jgi:putative tryptophan/tyrosine transport system substrate-binding protein
LRNPGRPKVAAGATVFLLFSFLAWGAAAQVRVVAVRSGDLPPYDQALKGFQRSLSSQGVQADVEIVTLPGNPVGDEALLENLNRQPPALVLAVGASAAKLCRLHVKTAPVLFCMVLESDEFDYGGVSLSLPLAENLEWIFKSLPQFKKVGVIYNPERWGSLSKEVSVLEKKGVLVAASAVIPADLDRAVASLKGRVDALLLLPDPVLFPIQTVGSFLAQTIRSDFPVIGVSPSYVKAGAIAAFFADYENNGELAAAAAARVLRGEKIRSIPILAPTKVAAGFNLVIARHMNRDISDEVFRVAVYVVK